VEKVAEGDEKVMTLQGTVTKTALLLLFVIIPATYTWNMYASTQDLSSIMLYLWTGSIGGLSIAFSIVYNMD